MHWKEWVKAAAVAAGAGAASAISTAILDPRKFNLSDGLGDEALIALQGAVVGLACLFIRSPIGTSLMKFIAEAKRQSAEDRETLERAQKYFTAEPEKPKPRGRRDIR